MRRDLRKIKKLSELLLLELTLYSLYVAVKKIVDMNTKEKSIKTNLFSAI